MQTFMPYGDYVRTATVLDNKRLNKQRIEAWQVLCALNGKYAATGAWVNHPAVIMWQGHEQSLIEYGLEMCREWSSRGGKDDADLFGRFNDAWIEYQDKPWWVSYEPLNLSHQSNLVRKDPTHYDFNVPNDFPYLWPKPDGTFKWGEAPKVIQNV